MDNRGQDQRHPYTTACVVLLAAGKALMTKDMSSNLFSSCKSFEALHVKVYLGRKAMPNRPKNLSIYASFPHQAGESGTIFAISPEEINTTGLRTTLHILYPKIEQERGNLYHFRPCGAETRSTIVRIPCLIVSPMELRLSRLQHE